jgi:hypothetical protein
MANNPEKWNYQEDVFSSFCGSKYTPKYFEALKQKLTFENSEEQMSDCTWNTNSVATKRCGVDEDQMQIESKIAQYQVDESDFNF